MPKLPSRLALATLLSRIPKPECACEYLHRHHVRILKFAGQMIADGTDFDSFDDGEWTVLVWSDEGYLEECANRSEHLIPHRYVVGWDDRRFAVAAAFRA